jgi:hypothetical protein
MHVQELAPLSENRPLNESQYRPFSDTDVSAFLVSRKARLWILTILFGFQSQALGHIDIGGKMQNAILWDTI